MQSNKRLLLSVFLILVALNVKSQDVMMQPPGNYGLTSVLDGAPPAPGVYLMEYLSYYSGVLQNKDGNAVAPNMNDDIKISSALLLNQLVWITDTDLFGGKLLFDALVPVVLLDSKDPYDLVGKSGLGDVTVGVGVQWFNKKLFGKPYFHRLEFDVLLPTGSFDLNEGTTPVNAGAKFLTFQPYYAQTLMLTKDFSVSLRHHLSFNGKFKEVPGVDFKAGTFYHVNYAFEHIIGKKRFKPGVSGETRFAIQGYYGGQFNEDTVNGVDMVNSRERVFAIGPDIHIITKKGLALEFKVAFETEAVNRPKGVRSTFRLVKYFAPKQKKSPK